MEPERKRPLLLFRRSRHSGGAEKAADRLSSQLSSFFEEVHLLVEGTGIENWKIPLCRGPGWFRLITYARAANNLLRNLPSESFSLSMERGVRAQVYRAGEGIHLAWMKRKGLARSIFSFRPLHPVAIWLENRSIRSARRIVANSEMIADEIRTYYPKHSNRVRVIENGYDESRFFVEPESLNREKTNGKRTLCFAGNGWERKGLEEAIHLLSELSEEWELTVLGRGNESKYRQLARSLHCESRVAFRGEVTNIAECFNASDAFLLPTKYDPFSNACLEAAACGCPVITTRENGFHTLIRHKENGYLLENGNFEECANWLEHELPTDRGAIAAFVASNTIARETENYRQLFREITEEDTAEV